METYDLVVVGSGPAGEKAAALAAYFGKRVAVVERDGPPGGAPGQPWRDPHQDAARDRPVPDRLPSPGDLRSGGWA
jgi:flavin-dependent dehydrogenase